MFVHCNMKVPPDVIWILQDNDEYTKRRLEIANCPVCRHVLCKELYTRKKDNVRYTQIYSRDWATHRIEQLKKEVVYRTDKVYKNNALRGFVYGENKEKNTKSGKVIIQNACDWYGTKKEVYNSGKKKTR